MCLAIPGQIQALDEEDAHFAVIEVSGVRRRVNVDLLRDDGLAEGDWVLIHVGFAMAKISESDAREQLDLLRSLGELEEAGREVAGYDFDRLAPAAAPGSKGGSIE